MGETKRVARIEESVTILCAPERAAELQAHLVGAVMAVVAKYDAALVASGGSVDERDAAAALVRPDGAGARTVAVRREDLARLYDGLVRAGTEAARDEHGEPVGNVGIAGLADWLPDAEAAAFLAAVGRVFAALAAGRAGEGADDGGNA